MDTKNLDTHAKKLHAQWLHDNKGFVEQCCKDPHQSRCARDFSRAVSWKNLPDVWKNHYRREARIHRLTQGKR